MTVRVSGVRATLEQNEDDLEREVARHHRATALSAYGNLVRTTPVDTGRARNSWTVSWDFPNITDSQSSTVVQQTLTPRSRPGVIWFANGVDYIRALNEGHSRQAPTRFIEQAIRRGIPEADLSSID